MAKKTKWESRVSIFTHSNLICDPDFTGRTGMLVARFTWKHSQALDNLTPSGLHRNPVIAHQECKHDQGHKLAGVGLQGTESEEQSVCVTNYSFSYELIYEDSSCLTTCAE